MKFRTIIPALLALTLLISPASAEESKYGTREEAMAMVQKAAALLKENETKAIEAFHDKTGEFQYKDLYVFVFDKDGKFKAHGAKPILVGKPGMNMTDVTGFSFVKAITEIKDAGWVKYKWGDALDNGKLKEKTSYIVKVNDDAIAVGYFEK